MMKRWLWLLAFQLTASCGAALAHETLPASLIIEQQSPQQFEVRWRIPQTQGTAPSITPVFPADCTAMTAPAEIPAPGARLRQWQMRCEQGLSNGTHIVFDGLPVTMIDVLTRVAYLDGSSETHIARSREPEIVLGQNPAQALAVSSYFGLGVKHILTGIDHLLFVFCLMLLVPNLLALLKTITAFTLAHSLTLALAALQLVQVPQPPIEASIALSILFLARELSRRNSAAGTAIQRPWAVAFAFGLLHGFGFAGALSEVGLPQGDIPQALLLFNLGVEAGQLAFVLGAFPLLLLLRCLQRLSSRWLGALPVYAVGAVSGFWFLQRMVPIFGLRIF